MSEGGRFGSLASAAEIEKMRAQQSMSASLNRGETMDIDSIESSTEKEVLAEFERRRRGRGMVLPTDDHQVKMKLRSLNQPICLFGEDLMDRRERLRAMLSTMSEDEVAQVLMEEEEKKTDQQERDSTTWYHRGPASLRTARLRIADMSLRRAKARLEKAKAELARPQHEKALHRQEAHKFVQQLNLHASQVADTRPVSFCEFSPDSQHIVTSGWSGQCCVWKREDCSKVQRMTGHSAPSGCARFHPRAFTGQSKSEVNVASCAHDGTVMLWSLDKEQPLAELEQHTNRVNRLAFHPDGRHLATACFDQTWRMFDIETGEELLIQEGHSKGVSDVAIHPDGSLALTSGLDCYGRVWDLRTGRCVMFLDGHTKEIHSVDWMPNGFEMLSAGADNTVKVWDVRMRRCVYTMAAHSSVISRIKVDKEGQYIVTSSFDCTLKLWSTKGWQPLRSLQGHDTKIMSVDVSPDGKWIMSAAFDRTFKLWNQCDY